METEIRHNPAESRIEAWLDGRRAGLVDYRLDEGVANMVHTEVDPAYEGRGVGTALVRGALDRARAENWRVIPTCWFIARYIDRHPDQSDLLAHR